LAPATWQGKEADVAKLLSFLTGDYWQVQFTASPLVLPAASTVAFTHTGIAHINLFSGGLDSLIGAIDFLKNQPSKKLLLVSHYDANMHGPKSDQNKLASELTTQFSQQFEWSSSVGVFLEDTTLANQENTLRSRSLLFISLAVLMGDAAGANIPIWVPENGSVSLNYPLSASRRSSCSTRTTHPRVIQDIRRLLAQLGLSTSITNPYEFQTKGEMVAGCADLPFLLSIVGESNSCGKRGHPRGWIRLGSSHCGVCMPCVYRRASLLGHVDPTTYGNNLEEMKYDAAFQRLTTKRGQDLDACLSFLATKLTPRQIRTELLINGIDDLAKLPGYATLVGRTRQELEAWVSTCPEPKLRNKAGLP
jgi:7-cyano-7-deazaguanine synthase in queuosine biosynthesis